MTRGTRGGPGGPRRPGRPRSARPAGARPRPLAATGSSSASQAAGGRRRPRLTGRALVLVLVLAVLTVSYASSMKAYLQQRSQIDALKTQISERESNINALEREKERWHDPAFVQAQARERLSYVMPGEKSYVVLDKDGKPLDSEATLHDPHTLFERTPQAWWTDAWASVQLAGNPPKTQAPPPTILKK